MHIAALQPTCESFCELLKVHLKSNVPLMKPLRPFIKTFYSEIIMMSEAGDVKAAGGDDEKKLALDGTEEGGTTSGGLDAGFHGGLYVFA